jgi:hypothetical protein
LGISSPAGRNTFFSKIFNAKFPSTDRNVVNGYVYEGCCDDCKRKEKPENCNHEPWKYPPWLHAGEKMEAIRAILADDIETFNKEQKGILMETEKNVYVEGKLVERLRKRPLYIWRGQEHPSFILIACDPNQGGECDTAVTALCCHRGNFIVSTFFLFSYVCNSNRHSKFTSRCDHKLFERKLWVEITVQKRFAQVSKSIAPQEPL